MYNWGSECTADQTRDSTSPPIRVERMNTGTGFEQRQLCPALSLQGWCPYTDRCPFLHMSGFNQNTRPTLPVGIPENNTPIIPVSSGAANLHSTADGFRSTGIPVLEYSTRSQYSPPNYDRGAENITFPGPTEHILGPRSDIWNSSPAAFPILFNNYSAAPSTSTFTPFAEPRAVLPKPMQNPFGNVPQYFPTDPSQVQNSAHISLGNLQRPENFPHDNSPFFFVKPAERSNVFPEQQKLLTTRPLERNDPVQTLNNKPVPDIRNFTPSPIDVSFNKREDIGSTIKKECRYYAAYGSCHFGINCKFEHVGKLQQQSPVVNHEPFKQDAYQDMQNRNFSLRESRSHSPSGKQETCLPSVAEPIQVNQRIFGNSSAGFQTFERSKGFNEDKPMDRLQHSAGNVDSASIDNINSSPQNVCRYFLNGKCTYQGTCKFFHPNPNKLQENHRFTDAFGPSSPHERSPISNDTEIKTRVFRMQRSSDDSCNSDHEKKDESVMFDRLSQMNIQNDRNVSSSVSRSNSGNPTIARNIVSHGYTNSQDYSKDYTVRKFESETNDRNCEQSNQRGDQGLRKYDPLERKSDQMNRAQPTISTVSSMERRPNARVINNNDPPQNRSITTRTFRQTPIHHDPIQGQPPAHQETPKPEDIKRLRITEIEQIRRRYPRLKHEIATSSDIFFVEVIPLNPKWAFDVKTVNLQITLPFTYPKETLTMAVPTEKNENAPPALMKHLTEAIQKWCHEQNIDAQKKDPPMLIFRPFMSWLDRNLERLFTEGYRLARKESSTKTAVSAEVQPVGKVETTSTTTTSVAAAVTDDSKKQTNSSSNKTASTTTINQSDSP